MSHPIKPAYEIGKLAGAIAVIRNEIVARRVGLDTYQHFWITVNWRKFAGMVQALVAFELLLAAMFTGRGLSIFGTAIEHRLFHSAEPLLTSIAFFAISIGGVGLYCNRRWAFLMDGILSIVLVMGAFGSIIYLVFEGTARELAGSASGCILFSYAAFKLLSRYHNFDQLRSGDPQENPIPAKNS